MRKIVIFDFKRTIFDPDTGKLTSGTKQVLLTLKNRGFDLFLVSHGLFKKVLIDELGVGSYFEGVIISKEKSVEDFKKIVSENNVGIKNSFVVGDRVRGEIAFGNSLGFQTIWLKKGLFAKELPSNYQERPNFVVSEIKEVLEIAH